MSVMLKLIIVGSLLNWVQLLSAEQILLTKVRNVTEQRPSLVTTPKRTPKPTPGPNTTPFLNCNQDQVKCYDLSRCLPISWICDGIKDCVDNSDEIDCSRRQTTSTGTTTTTFYRRTTALASSTNTTTFRQSLFPTTATVPRTTGTLCEEDPNY